MTTPDATVTSIAQNQAATDAKNTAPSHPQMAEELTAMANWIEPYRDVLSDANDALNTIQRRLQALASTGRDVPAQDLLELLDMVDTDYLTEELPGAMSAMDDSVIRMRRMSDPNHAALTSTAENLEIADLPEIVPSQSATVLAFPSR